MNPIRITLITTAIAFAVVALVIFGYILYRVFQIKKNINNDRRKLANELLEKEGEQKLLSRVDFGEENFEIKNLLNQTIDHEIVEFSINSCIRNSFKNVLLIGNVGVYEAIVLSNKANVEVNVKKESFDLNNYNKIKNSINYQHTINFVEDDNKIYDSILLLQHEGNFDEFFDKFWRNLKENGMFIIANTNKYKKTLKSLSLKMKKTNVKYDILKWHNGFIVIVK